MAGGAVLHRRIEVPNALEQVARLQAAVEEWCEEALGPTALFKLSMAIDELATNITMHGRRSPVIVIETTIDEHQVVVELRDRGPAFDPFVDAPPPVLDGPIEDRPIGGLGVYLVKTMVDEVSYRRQDGENIVRLGMNRIEEKSGTGETPPDL